MSTKELLDRILEFVPELQVFWIALSIMLLILGGQYVYEWLVRITRQPWMYDHNQHKRHHILQKQKRRRTSLGKKT
jgi:hypothetical protein